MPAEYELSYSDNDKPLGSFAEAMQGAEDFSEFRKKIDRGVPVDENEGSVEEDGEQNEDKTPEIEEPVEEENKEISGEFFGETPEVRADNREDYDEDYMLLGEMDLPDWVFEKYPFINDLPESIAVMGGVARSIAREVITGDKEPIRDIDLVHICDGLEDELSDDILDEYSRKYMADDYSHGHGIGEDTTKNYFATRDFTINQVLIKDKKLIYSEFAYDDFQENIIRPTYYELSSDARLSSRLFLKSLLLKTVLSEVTSSVPLLEGFSVPYRIYPFDVALTLNKAMSRGVKTARSLTRELAEWRVIPDELADRPKATAVRLADSVWGFQYRPPEGLKDSGDSLFSDMDGFFYPESLGKFYTGDPKLKAAIAEYEDDEYFENGDFYDNFDRNRPIIEKEDGKYTAADYAEINRFYSD